MKGKHQIQTQRRQASQREAATAQLLAELESLTQEMSHLAAEDAALRERLLVALVTLRDRSAAAERELADVITTETEAAAVERRVHTLASSLRRWIIDMWERDLDLRNQAIIPRESMPLLFWALTRSGGALTDSYRRHRALRDWLSEHRGEYSPPVGDDAAPSYMWKI